MSNPGWFPSGAACPQSLAFVKAMLAKEILAAGGESSSDGSSNPCPPAAAAAVFRLTLFALDSFDSGYSLCSSHTLWY